MEIADSAYLSLRTYRRDGSSTACPVWCADDGDELVFRTFERTLKARRLSRDDRVEVAPCDRGGRVCGVPRSGTARVLTGPDARRAHRQIRRRVGWLTTASDLSYRGRLARPVAYAVTVEA